jgi:hypothetical protein
VKGLARKGKAVSGGHSAALPGTHSTAWATLAERLHHRPAVDPRHLQIGDDQRIWRGALLDQPEPRLAIHRLLHAPPGQRQHEPYRPAHVGVVVDHQDHTGDRDICHRTPERRETT